MWKWRFNTQPPEGGWLYFHGVPIEYCPVSTHSRLKAAGIVVVVVRQSCAGFNTQPPEGGWAICWLIICLDDDCFNTQPPEGGWFA